MSSKLINISVLNKVTLTLYIYLYTILIKKKRKRNLRKRKELACIINKINTLSLAHFWDQF